jgi:23S rRNA-/tRNA-specific pseudouridylate synthase
MFFPKHKKAATHISYLLKTGEVEKLYWALVPGCPEEDAWTVDAPIAKLNKFRYGVALPGRDARTEFRVLAAGRGATLVEARPLTGRTHQIRVHLVHSGLPIIGDQPYGGLPAPRMMLHCRAMAFKTRDGREVRAEAPVDKDFAAVCGEYGIEAG